MDYCRWHVVRGGAGPRWGRVKVAITITFLMTKDAGVLRPSLARPKSNKFDRAAASFTTSPPGADAT
jgi:hypothetical protein